MDGHLSSRTGHVLHTSISDDSLQRQLWANLSLIRVAFAIGSLLIARFLASAIHSLYFSPLSKYPGSPLAAVTELVYTYHTFRGNSVNWITSLHERYGPVVRLGPDRMDYIDPAAWKDIFGHNTVNHKANPKDSRYLKGEANGHDSLLTIRDDAEHGRVRRIFAHAFSDRALAQQEASISHYVDQLVDLIKRKITADPCRRPSLDAVQLYNFTTFDVMSDLTFSEPLNNLTTSENSFWVRAIFESFKAITLIRTLAQYPVLQKLWLLIMPSYLKESMKVNMKQCEQRVSKRMAKKDAEYPDIWNLVIKGGDRFTREELTSNSILFMLAGTETTATLLSGLTYQLLKNTDKYERLVQEICHFQDESKLNADTVRHLNYINACINEGLRIYPPVPLGMSREAAPGGNTILGDYIPEKTRLQITHFAAYHSALNFKDPEAFIPERWLLDEPGYEEYHKYDRRDVLQPFSYGPRNCLGKNLAYYEMRAILSRIVWNFHLELCPESADWMDQKTYVIWSKHPLMVKASLRKK